VRARFDSTSKSATGTADISAIVNDLASAENGVVAFALSENAIHRVSQTSGMPEVWSE